MQALPCSRCRTPLPIDAQFCGACGLSAPHRPKAAAPGGPGGSVLASQVGGALATPGVDRAALGFAAPGQGSPLCLGCGVVMPREQPAGTPCAVCQLDCAPKHELVAMPHPRGQRRYWVGVQCEFQCRACGHLSPLNHLDVDGSVQCLRCGIEQIFAVDTWRDGLAHAHAVADLAGPDGNAWRGFGKAPAGNPFRHVGVTSAVASAHEQQVAIRGDGLVEVRSLRVTASPGLPLCGRCRVPLTVDGVDEHQLQVSCRHCGDRQNYALPAPARGLCPGLRGVIADEHRIGGRQVEYDPNAAVVAIRCPNCQAPVSVSGKSTVIDCDYCHIALRIPDPLLHRLGHDHPEPALWWLLMSGPSPLRAELATAAKQAKQAKKAQKAAQRAAQQAVHKRLQRRKSSGEPALPPPGPIMRMLSWVVPLALCLAIGYYGFGDRMQRWRFLGPLITSLGDASERSDGRRDRATASAGGDYDSGDDGDGDNLSSSDDGDWPGPRERFTSARQCNCRGRLDGKRVDVALAGRIRELGDLNSTSDVDIALAYYLDVGEHSYRLDVGDDTAPPARVDERALGIGVGCHQDRIILAAGKQLTAWSIKDGQKLWSQALEEPYRHRARARDRGLNVRCDRLRVRRGRVKVPLGRKRSLRFDADTGDVSR
ncbi:MAG: hypothetical protein Tsb0020_40220 [Haliangiales bacterium]